MLCVLRATLFKMLLAHLNVHSPTVHERLWSVLCSGSLRGLRVIVQGFGVGITPARRVVRGVRVVASSPGRTRVVLRAAQPWSRRVPRVLPLGRPVIPRRRRAGPAVIVVATVGPHHPPLLLRAVEAVPSHQRRRVAIATRQGTIVTIIVVVGTSIVIVTVPVVRVVPIISVVIVTVVVFIVIVAVATVTTIIILVIAIITRGLVPIINRGVTGNEVLVGVPFPGGHVGVVIVRGHVVVPSGCSVVPRRVVLIEAALEAVLVVSVLPR